MLAYRTPGVYAEWLDTRPPIQAVRSDIAGFVGLAERGPLHTAVRLESWTQYVSVFGSYIPQGYLAYAVRAFFENGGRTCWVVRVADPTRATSAVIELTDDRDRVTVRLIATSQGMWGKKLSADVVRVGTEAFNLTIHLADGGQELWRDLTLESIVDELEQSSLVQARLVKSRECLEPPQTAHYRPRAWVACRGGADGLASDGLTSLEPKHFSGIGAPIGETWGLAALAEIDEIGILAMPDLMSRPHVQIETVPRPSQCEVLDIERVITLPIDKTELPPVFSENEIVGLQTQLIAQCERLKDRVAILDLPDSRWSPTEALGWLDRHNIDTTYAALYYPWLRVPDPLELDGLLRDVPSSGHVAGIYARVDTRSGVHKPPANESIELAQDVTVAVDDVDHGRLNERGINALRAYPGRGLRVFGARTLSSDPSWQYINVRRLLIVIEESIDQQTQWLVFEPNQAAVWAEADRVVRSFLDDLWQRGWLDGSTADEAYSVICDATTNPPAETELGRFICQIGVQPPWPAEFVIVRIGRTENNTHVREE